MKCPRCGQNYAPRRMGRETKLSFMNRHRREHDEDIDAEEFHDA